MLSFLVLPYRPLCCPADLDGDRAVTNEEAKMYAEMRDMIFAEVSARFVRVLDGIKTRQDKDRRQGPRRDARTK